MEELLIAKVYEHPVLYDTTYSLYKDQNKRTEAWEQIGHDMRLPGGECRIMWGKLRNCFANARKRRATKTGHSTKKITKWKYEDQMSFLIPHMEFREDPNSLTSLNQSVYIKNECLEFPLIDMNGPPPGIVEPWVAESTGSIESEVEDDPEDHTSSPALLQDHDSSMNARTPKNKIFPARTTANNREHAEQPQQTLKDAGTEAIQQLDRCLHDATEMFYLSMAKTVKNLPIVDQAKIRMELCRMVSEAEIRQEESKSSKERL
ncbi:uncharacterized protein [Periplaneta americana]|uniref:uncharacterized protein n=1 Tax=Periplaneta americana TaxID=6978 RepID=UPI0037E77D19